MKKKLVAVLGITAVAVTMTACSPTTNVRGYVPDERVMNAIRPGVDNQSSVRAVLGSPSVPGLFEENRWYYVSRTTETLAFFDPEILEQQVVAISFDNAGYVTAVNRVGLDEARNVNPVNDQTPTRGRELGFWEQIFGNIGRFSGGAPAGGAGGP